MNATILTAGGPAAGLTRPSAQRARPVNGQPNRAEPREPRSGALDRPVARSYPDRVPSTPTPMSPEPGCVIHARISEKDSDTGQPVAIERHPGNSADPATCCCRRDPRAVRDQERVPVGDRGMTTQTRSTGSPTAIGYITALRAPQTAKLRVGPDSRFDL